MYKIFLIFLLLMSGCVNNKQTLSYNSNDEYALAFFDSINTLDLSTLDKLINEDSIIIYNGINELHLGNTSDKASHLSYLLSLKTSYSNIKKCENQSNYAVCFETNTTNYILNDIFKEKISSPTTFEFVIENKQISLIYIYENTEEKAILNEYTTHQIGIEISSAEDNSCLKISEVYAGSPASSLDLKVDDLIYEIDGIKISDMNGNIDEPTLRLNGKDQTSVKLLVKRSGSEKLEELSLTRLNINRYIFDESKYYDDEYYYEYEQPSMAPALFPN